MLAALLEPLTTDEFLGSYWLKRHVWCRGAADRFSGLLSWPILNRILEHHWREPYRFRLARQGHDLEAGAYTDEGPLGKRIRAREVTEQLRCGATLSFDAIDEVHEPLTRLAESFEAFFRGGTKINIYAGWRACHGLDLHRDNQEIFIAQLDGRKRWLLYGFSANGLDRTGLREHSSPPAGAEFDEILTPGDVLYIPRGCYHLAVPMNEPTLHLTIGVKNPRETDLLQWLVDRQSRERRGRTRPACLAALGRTHPLQRTDPHHALERARRRPGGTVPGRDRFELQAAADFQPSVECNRGGASAWRELSPAADGAAPLHIKADASAVILRHARSPYRFPRSVTAIIDQLGDGVLMPIGALIDAGRSSSMKRRFGCWSPARQARPGRADATDDGRV